MMISNMMLHVGKLFLVISKCLSNILVISNVLILHIDLHMVVMMMLMFSMVILKNWLCLN